MPASDDDREMMARFNDTFRKLKTNREQVPLEVLQTKYGKAYQKLTKEMAGLADWFAARLRERMPFFTNAPRKSTNPTGKNTTTGTFTRTATAGSGTTSQVSSGRTASRETIRIHSPTRGATGWTPRANTRVQPSHHISKEIRYGKQSRIDCPF